MASRWLQVSIARAEIYGAANPLCSGRRKRTTECTATVRRLYLDLDTDGEARLTPLRASDALPMSIAFISTSAGKYQVLWGIDCSTFERQESTLKLPSIAFGSDPICTDFNWMPRLRGFLKCKYDPTYPVTVEYLSDST